MSHVARKSILGDSPFFRVTPHPSTGRTVMPAALQDESFVGQSPLSRSCESHAVFSTPEQVGFSLRSYFAQSRKGKQPMHSNSSAWNDKMEPWTWVHFVYVPFPLRFSPKIEQSASLDGPEFWTGLNTLVPWLPFVNTAELLCVWIRNLTGHKEVWIDTLVKWKRQHNEKHFWIWGGTESHWRCTSQCSTQYSCGWDIETEPNHSGRETVAGLLCPISNENVFSALESITALVEFTSAPVFITWGQAWPRWPLFFDVKTQWHALDGRSHRAH